MKKQPEATTKTETMLHKNKDFIIGIAICIIALSIIIGVVLFARQQTKIAYQPVNACEAFTATEAGSLLEGEVINGTKTAAQLSGDAAISKCAYSNANEDTNKMLVAAVTIRSAINDDGIAQNKSEFLLASKSVNVEPVANVGDDAFYNQTLGQLNILRDKQWLIVSYGVGSAPQENTLDNLKLLAKQVTN